MTKTLLVTGLVILISAGGYCQMKGNMIAGFSKESGYFYQNSKLEGLVGNGHMIVTTNPGSFSFRFERILEKGRIGVRSQTQQKWLDELNVGSFFVPGAVIYATNYAGCRIEVIYSSPYNSNLFVTVVKIQNPTGSLKDLQVIFEIESEDMQVQKDRIVCGNNCVMFNRQFHGPAQGSTSGRMTLNIPVTIPARSHASVMLNAGKQEKVAETIIRNPIEVIREICEHYTERGLKLDCPDNDLDRAVLFLKYHLQLGYDWPEMMVCDIFRWRDLWSRDFGSGFGPGALAAGMLDAVRSTLEYELERLRTHPADGYKLSEDTSQGGSAEGIGLVLDVVWQYYLYTGDREFLDSAYKTYKPWVESWISRDYDEDGLIIDVTEWMDHSRFFRLPEGMQTLYSNVLFGVMLQRFGDICRVLGKKDEQEYYYEYAAMSRDSVNKKLWDRKGFYDNYTIWGVNDERLASAANSLAILYGVSDREKTNQILNSLRRTNWRKFGSATIFPAMTIVGPENDQNVKAWPWWEAKEAKARFLNGDISGGMQVLKWCTDTMKYELYPGLIEEYIFNPDTGEIQDFAGHTFISAAGSTLDSIVNGLLGFSVCSPGSSVIQITPRTPANWNKWSAVFPLPDGTVEYKRNGNKISIIPGSNQITELKISLPYKDSKVLSVVSGDKELKYEKVDSIVKIPVNKGIVGSEIIISFAGSRGLHYVEQTGPRLPEGTYKKKQVKHTKTTVKSIGIFKQSGIPSGVANQDRIKQVLSANGYAVSYIDANGLATIIGKSIDVLILTGNVFPLETPEHNDINLEVEKYLDKGGKLILLEPRAQPKGKIGEEGSLFQYMVYSPRLKSIKITGPWKLKFTDSDKERGNKEEDGYGDSLWMDNYDDRRWASVKVPSWWEDEMHEQYDGYGWYRKKITIPESCKGRKLYVRLGKIDDIDWTYLNGELLGSAAGWQEIRFYPILPGTKVYEKINWGGKNLLAIQVLDTGGGGGIHEGEQELIYEDTSSLAWQYYDPLHKIVSNSPARGGVVSWGKGKFFQDWALTLGLFGFQVKASGVEFTSDSLLAGTVRLNVQVNNAYTDFPVKSPWIFTPLAYTTKSEKWVISTRQERIPCAALLTNYESGGRIAVLAPEIAASDTSFSILKRLLESF